MPFPLKRLVPVLCVLGCSTYIDPGFDAPFDVSVGDAGIPDVRAPDASEFADAFEFDALDAPDSPPGPELADCFSEPLLIAQASSRLGVGGIVALEEGWLVSYFGGEGHNATLIDRAGHVVDRPNAGFRASLVALGRGSFAQVSGHEVRRFTWSGGELRTFEPVMIGIGWGSTLTTDADVAEGRVRVLSYDPVEHVGDLRLRITQLDLDDSSPTGFSVRTGALGASFTALLPRRLAYQQYSLRGDTLRVVGPSVSTHGGPYQTVLAQLDVRSLAGNEDLWYEIQESFTWGEGEELGSMLTGELHRMVRSQTNEDGSRGIRVESFPEHPGVTGDLGAGAYHVIDDMLFGIHRVDGELQIVRDSDLFVIGQTNMEGDFAGAARWGEDVAILSKRRNAEGTVLLELHCVETSVPSRP